MKLYFRLANINDAELLYEIRNDPLTRLNALDQSLVQYKDHIIWFEKSLLNSARKIYIVHQEDRIIGSIRFDKRQPKGWELTWALAANARGQGLGKLMLSQSLDLLTGPYYARIKEANVASEKIAIHSNFIKTASNGGIGHWIKE